MAVISSEKVDVRGEKALAAYIRGHRDANSDSSTFVGDLDLDCTRAGDLNGIKVHEGRQTQEVTTPAIVVAFNSSKPIAEGVSWYECLFEIILMTNWREDDSSVTRPEIVHGERAKAIDDLINCEETLGTALNIPVTGTDARAVDEFTVHGSWIENNTGEPVEGILTDRWELVLVCSPWDTRNR